MSGIFRTPTISNSEQRLASMRIQTSAYGVAVPVVYGTQRLAANLIWYGDFKATAHTTTQKAGGKGGSVKTSNTTYTYAAALMLGLCEGPLLGVARVWKGKDMLTDKPPSGGATTAQTPIQQLGLELATGTPAQSPWGYLVSKHADQALAYPSTAYLASGSYDLGGTASLDNHTFEVQMPTRLSETVPDADPAVVLADLLTNTRYGAGYPAAQLGDLSALSAYCRATGLLVSPALTEQRSAHEVITEILDACNARVFASAGKLQFVPLGDESASGNGASYTPSMPVRYDLTDDDFLGEDEPVRVTRKRESDAYNHVRVEFVNRANQYNTETVEAKDQANIELYGLRSEGAQKCAFFCDAGAARRSAQLRLQRQLYIRNVYEFRLGWRYCLLEPCDIVTLTDPGLGLDHFPVRITRIEEAATGELTVTAEELAAVMTAEDYGGQGSGGYAAAYSDPGSVFAPLIFEPPLSLTGGATEVWCAVAGGDDWGGAQVWASFDDQSYEQIGVVFGSARYGTLMNAVAAADTALQVQLNTGQEIHAGTLIEAQAEATLCYVGGELVSYQGAVLGSAAGSYALSGVLRGRQGGAAADHPAGAPFARLDKALFQYGFRRDLVGQTIFLKFLSFNSVMERMQTLADVTAYSHTLAGGALASVAGLALQAPFTGTRFDVIWLPVDGAESYSVQILSGGTTKRTVSSTSPGAGYSLEQARADGLARSFTVRVAAVAGGDVGSYAELAVSNPVPVAVSGLSATTTASSITASWSACNDVDLQDYVLCVSTSSGFDPALASPAWVGTGTTATVGGLSAGTYYLRVAAQDVWGGVGWLFSPELAVTI